MKFSKKEIKDLLIAWIAISFAFSILFTGISKIFTNDFIIAFFVSTLTAGIGFLLHEIMHKYVAQKYGLFAEFRAFYGMLVLAILISFTGFIFAAPGAVMIHGLINRERNGKISVAGPITNLVIAIMFLVGLFIFGKEGIVGMIFNYGFRINSLLALFNMIPVMPFDGAKVFSWNKKIFYMVGAISLTLFLLSWII